FYTLSLHDALPIWAMNDDFNTALTIGHLFNLLKRINSIHTGNLSTAALGQETFDKLKNTYISFVEDILGLREEKPDNAPQLIETLLAIYKKAKQEKDYDTVDFIRAELKAIGVLVKDMKTGIEWAYEE